MFDVRWARQYSTLALAGVLGLLAPTGCMDSDDDEVQVGPPAQSDRAGDQGNQGERARGEPGRLGYRGVVDRDARGSRFVGESAAEDYLARERFEDRYGWIQGLLGSERWREERQGGSGQRGQGDIDLRIGDLGDWTQDQGRGEAPGGMQDVAIAGILLAFNQAELDYLEIGVEDGKSELVQGYAADLLAHHAESLARQRELFASSNMRPISSREAVAWVDHMSDLEEGLADLEGGQLDLAFMEGQIEVHRAAIKLVDEVLLPAADSEALRAEIGQVRFATAQHLERGYYIHREIGGE